ncbi:hypothetical protein ACNQR9_00070 [Mycolicibacterium peregrinum]
MATRSFFAIRPYEDAVRKVMGGPMYLNWDQASANIDEHPDEPCRWPA